MSLLSLDSFSRSLLDLTLAGTLLLRPVYDEQQVIVDFRYDYVNPAAQYMLRLPAEPTHTLLQNRPHLVEAGVFAFYCEAYASGRAGYYGVDFTHDGLDSYYQLAAHRQGERLLVSFTDTADRNQGSIELALRESQVRERTARAEAERQRQALQRAFEQAPVAIAVYRGPQYIIELANPTVCRLWGRTAEQILGRGLFEALPEVAGMGYEQLLDGVMATGEPYVAYAMPAVHEREGRRDTVYWDFVYVPMYELDGSVYGAMVVATEVTAQVLARQQLG